MELIGEIVRLQVQRSSLKVGERPQRRYDPTPILAVRALRVDSRGVIGKLESGETVVDVHNRDHPASKNRQDNGISFCFTSHYASMRSSFGEHLLDGIAGENVLVRAERRFDAADLGDMLIVETASGDRLRLDAVSVAEPCVEFSRFALNRLGLLPNGPAIGEALSFLRQGMRGYYASYDGAPATLRVGDRVYRIATPSASQAFPTRASTAS